MSKSKRGLAINSWLIVAVALLVGGSSYLLFVAASHRPASASVEAPDFGVLILSNPFPPGPAGSSAQVMSLVERAAFAGPAADVALPAALDLAGFQIIGCGGGRIENMLSDGLQPTIYLDWVTPYGPPDVEYMKPRVDQMHARGAKYMGYYSFGHLEGRGPEYFPTVTTDGVALDLDGNTVKADAGDDPALSITRPATRQMLLEVTKLAIDAGTDYVVYDVAFANQFPLAAGSFDPDAMAAFRTYLSANYSQAELDAMFGQSVDISTFDYREYLRARGSGRPRLAEIQEWAASGST